MSLKYEPSSEPSTHPLQQTRHRTTNPPEASTLKQEGGETIIARNRELSAGVPSTAAAFLQVLFSL